jgi:hypothetical protein
MQSTIQHQEQVTLIVACDKTYIAYESDINPRYWLAVECVIKADSVISVKSDAISLLPKMLCNAQQVAVATN